MKKIKKNYNNNGVIVNTFLDLRKLLLLNYQNLTNKSQYVGIFDIPSLYCNTTVFPDFIALYTETSYYHKTDFTAVGFFQFDKDFDGQNGLYSAIYNNNIKQLKAFEERFKGIKFVFSPDYSLLEDNDEIENIYRLKKMRVVSLRFIHVIGAIVIPLITFPSLKSIDLYISGLENSSVVGISTKGHIDEPIEYEILCKTIKYLVKNKRNLKAIVVYDVCGDNTKTLKAFEIAEVQGIKIIIPDNSLKIQNRKRWRINHETL